MKNFLKMISNKYNPSLEIRYYKHFFGRRILLSKPIQCHKKGSFEVHILTCEKDFLAAMWCLKTFYYFLKMRPLLVVHDDGSLSRKSRQVFAKHFLNCKMIMREDANKKVKSFLKDYEYCLKYRYESFMVHSIKLFDSIVYARANGLLILDSDMLFFKMPTELSSCINYNKGFFIEDYHNAYSFEKEYLSQLFGIKVIDKVNTGLVFLPNKNIFDFDLVESFLKEAYLHDYPNKSWIEQTAFALIFSKYSELFKQLGNDYQISRQFISGNTVSHHFVADGSRDNFYKEGLKRLNKKGFLKNFRLAYKK